MGFVRLRNQNITLIGIREKMKDLGEKMKTHVSKISLVEISPRGSLSVTRIYEGETLKV